MAIQNFIDIKLWNWQWNDDNNIHVSACTRWFTPYACELHKRLKDSIMNALQYIHTCNCINCTILYIKTISFLINVAVVFVLPW